MTDEMTTQPTIETLLARMNEWGVNLTSELAQIKKGQAELQQSFEGLRQTVEGLSKGQEELRLTVEELHKGQDELHKGQGELRADLNSGLHRVKRQMQNLNDNFLEMQTDIRELNVQVEELEAESLTVK